ncbi:MAG TPA: hypothetical protein VE890_13045 [Thermoguttaceae bacterium]|nr:hypothetical protein [Thermoguttaceae bacterium]
MNLAILHYHLNRGGVTRVVENQLASLDSVLEADDPWRVALLFGGRREGFDEKLPGRLRTVRLALEEVPLLDYDNVRPDAEQASRDDLFRQLTSTLDRLQFKPADTVLHVHNHSLGKNRLLVPVVGRLAEAGYAVVLQIHDFAEDFRPANYRCLGAETDLFYPQSPSIHYAVLNRRDHKILHEAGIDADRLHFLPNPVPMPAGLPSKTEARTRLNERFGVAADQRFVLYPVRGIRRKNLGEALLYSALAPEGTIVGLTLAPLNPNELSIYTAWKELAADLKLPFRFECGEPGALTFAENLAAADVILTTSVAEGFGMVFLEAWLAERPLVGRDLPEITADFVEAGVRLDCLWPALRVPVEWIDAGRFRRTVADAYHRSLEAFNRRPAPDWEIALEGKITANTVDFADLDEPMQQQVLRTICRHDANRRRVLQDNPRLAKALTLDEEVTRPTIAENRQAIEQHFALRPSGNRLQKLYSSARESVRSGQPQPLVNAGRILDRFLELDRFRLIRS